MTKTTLLLLLSVALGLFACERGPAPITPADSITIDRVEKLVDMNQTLGWKIFKQEQLAKPGENILISPFSIQTALNMAVNGAKGNTREEILGMMDCQNCAVADLNRLHQDLNLWLTEQSGPPEFTVANGFFYDPNRVNVKPPFVDTLAKYYQCVAENVNFDAEQAALDKINGWVKTNTKEKIDKILDKITALDVAFLINALHFKADWATGFAAQLTNTFPFKKTDGTEIPVDFVNADRLFSFAQTANFNLVDIPFKDSTFSISFIQPSLQNTDADWHLNISPETWLGLYDAVQYQRAMVFFPKLKLSYEHDLIKSLQNLGVEDAFSPTKADFADLGTAAKNIFINQIKHKAILEIDEKGAEGAAVTSIGFGITSAPPTFWFNRPYVLVLRHVPTNTMIFMGFVTDPTQ